MTTTTAPGRNISAAEAARRLGISVRTLDRMGAEDHPQHLVPVTRTRGGHRRYDADEVERIRTGAEPAPASTA